MCVRVGAHVCVCVCVCVCVRVCVCVAVMLMLLGAHFAKKGHGAHHPCIIHYPPESLCHDTEADIMSAVRLKHVHPEEL